jgi:hypothetical protein
LPGFDRAFCYEEINFALTETNITEFVTAISTLHWCCDYYQFCKILGFNPDPEYSRTKWQQFQELNKSLNYFDINSLMKLIVTYQKQSHLKD